jgi:hypothetical protein
MRILMITIVAMFVSISSASAGKLVSELKIYKDVVIQFNETAGKCNLSDGTIFKNRLEQGIMKSGLQKNPESRIVAVLNIAAVSFGLLNAQCATTVSLNLQSFLDGKEVMTNNPDIRAVLDEVGTFPISIFRVGMFGVQAQTQPSAGGKSVSVQNAILEMIDRMVAKLNQARGR